MRHDDGAFYGRPSYEGPPRQTAPKAPVNAVYADSYRSEWRAHPILRRRFPHNHPKSLRAHLHSLLPRHAIFHAQIEIHQISSVPLVHGEFAVRWKLKNLTTPPGSKSSLLGIVKSRRSGGTSPTLSTVDIKGKGRRGKRQRKTRTSKMITNRAVCMRLQYLPTARPVSVLPVMTGPSCPQLSFLRVPVRRIRTRHHPRLHLLARQLVDRHHFCRSRNIQ